MRIVAATVCFVSALCAQSLKDDLPPPGQGSVCITAVLPPTPGEKSLANPAGGNLVKVYSIKIDDLEPIRGLPDRPVEAPLLSLADKHIVRIFGDGKQTASFYFRFGTFATNEVCLLFDELYVTWNLVDCEEPIVARARAILRRRLPWVETPCRVVGMRAVPANGQFYIEYQVKYSAEGREFFRFVESGLAPTGAEPSPKALQSVPRECRYKFRYHPGMPEKAVLAYR